MGIEEHARRLIEGVLADLARDAGSARCRRGCGSRTGQGIEAT